MTIPPATETAEKTQPDYYSIWPPLFVLRMVEVGVAYLRGCGRFC
jgi:hypothetical protein